MIKEAIILAGGLGTRLQSIVADVPKCMAPVEGIPFINFVISHLKNEGVERFILALGYKSDIVVDYISKTFKRWEIEYSVEDQPLGTGGAVKLALQKVKGENVLVVNGDTLFNININDFTAVHQMKDAAVTVALKQMKRFNRYGTVEIDANLTILSFKEKQFCEEGFINGGIYALNRIALLNEPLPQVFSFEKDFLEKNIICKNQYGLPYNSYFIDIGIPEDYKQFIDDYKLINFNNRLKKTGGADNFLIGELFFEGLFSILD